ncbi:MAG: carboxypeptidase regulatory-like domain-containing protein [Bacteroidota bacterium]
MSKRITFLFLVLLTGTECLISNLQAQGVTTSAMSGVVQDEKGNGLEGATVIATHTPSGTRYGAISRNKGYFNFATLRVGGPYEVLVSYVGFEDTKVSNLYLALGQTKRVSVNMKSKDLNLGEVLITSSANPLIDDEKTGAETKINEREINSLPTINRDLQDFTRLTPQANVSQEGVSIAGANNRFNSIFIDGAVNNDVFGLASSGTNGGQTGVTPISLDAIEQLQVVVAPYDVKFGGFAGGGINAVTRSGSNEVEASAYWLFRNASMVGKTPDVFGDQYRDADDEGRELIRANRERVAPFTANTYGLRVGGPIIKDKLFFFISGEQQRDETPNPFDFGDYIGDASLEDLTAFENRLEELGWSSGGFLNNTDELNSDKLLIRLDFNANENHKFTLRHSYTRAENINPGPSTRTRIDFFNNGVFFPSTTNSTAFEWNATYNNINNQLIVGYTSVRDDRDPLGSDFPYIVINDGAGEIQAGSEPFSTGNQLDQDIVTLTNNFNYYMGNHTFTVGTHNEFFSIYNLFLRRAYGEYQYNTIDDFLNGNDPTRYRRGYSLVDDIPGDGSAAAAEFNAMQLAFYVQDEWQATPKLNLTFGLRLDIPLFLDDPQVDDNFNEVTIPDIEAVANDGSVPAEFRDVYNLQGARAGDMPSAGIMFGPRVGFNYDVTGENTTLIRGGVGIFTSRIPFVWPGGAFTNNGLTIGGVDVRNPDIDFRPEVDNQYTNTDFGLQDAIPSGQMDLFADGFQYPQVLRASLAVDHQLPGGFVGTLEGIFTKTLNNVVYYNLNINAPTETLDGPDGRAFYPGDRIDNTYSDVILADNTNEGYTFNVTAQLQKSFKNGFSGSLAYTYGTTRTLNDGTSSQNSSQWRFTENVNGANYLDQSFSDFDLGHRIVGYVSYQAPIFRSAPTTFSLFYSGQSGTRFSYIYDDGGDLKNDDFAENALVYVPGSQEEIIFGEEINDNLLIYTQVRQNQEWAALDEFISQDPHLDDRRGDYAERNGSRLPFENILDLRIMQDFYINAGKGNDKHRFQVSCDILNFTALLGDAFRTNLGRQYFVSNDNFQLLSFEGFTQTEGGDRTPVYSFREPTDADGNVERREIFTLDQFASRWRMQFGVRYLFN